MKAPPGDRDPDGVVADCTTGRWSTVLVDPSGTSRRDGGCSSPCDSGIVGIGVHDRIWAAVQRSPSSLRAAESHLPGRTRDWLEGALNSSSFSPMRLRWWSWSEFGAQALVLLSLDPSHLGVCSATRGLVNSSNQCTLAGLAPVEHSQQTSYLACASGFS